jgi:hypothetical protein
MRKGKRYNIELSNIFGGDGSRTDGIAWTWTLSWQSRITFNKTYSTAKYNHP